MNSRAFPRRTARASYRSLGRAFRVLQRGDDRWDHRERELQLDLVRGAEQEADLGSPIEIIRFADAPDAAHADGRGGGSLIDRPDEVAEVRRAFDRIVAAALPEDRSVEMIRRVMEDIR